MGAWGEKPFENDSALDWVAELEEGGVEVLRETLSLVAETAADIYLDADDGSRAIAAAEVVAAALGLRVIENDEARAWLAKHGRSLTPEDRDLARRGVARVLGSESELRELWSESEESGPWHEDVGGLLEKLGGPIEGVEKVREKSPNRGAALEQTKQGLVTFLVGVRGFELSPEQNARIEASRDKDELLRWLERSTRVSSLEELFDE